ncbi:MAG TPA: MmgE/PrpD family protein [Dongiaceae bacterium]|nr:MmgE/PrpD family protein [Dongiaceae bacterium]
MKASIRDSKATEIVCAYSCGSTFEALPASVVDCAKRVILDTLGCMVLGSTIDSAQVMRKFVASIGGLPQATVIGGDLKAPAGYAALANGTAGHADEMDSSHISWGHPACIAIATGLALCESLKLGGKEFINAVVLMHDIGARMMAAAGGRQAVMDTHHSHSSALYAIGAAAAAGRLLRLKPEQMRHALALASMNISSPAAFMDESNHMTKAMTHGQSAYAGVTGAMLAYNGLEGNERILESRHGIMDLWWTDRADVGEITARLGSYFSVTDTGFKYYSAGYPIHAPLYGALSLLRNHGIKSDQVAKVRVGMGTQSAGIVDSRDTPSISLQAMLSLGMFLGKLGYEDAHDEAALEKPEVKRLRSVVQIFRDPDIDRRAPTSRAAWVEITTQDGRTVRADEQLPPGHWESGGAPWADLEEKFTALVVPRLGRDASVGIARLVKSLEDQSDLGELARLLAPRAKA